MLAPPWDARRVLGLRADVDACAFNLEGVLVESATFHAAAWRETFDELISERWERTGGAFAPFNPRTDYLTHLHGRPRIEGVREFLASRGMSLPEGGPCRPAGHQTVYGLANRKGDALHRLLRDHDVLPFAAARTYLELANKAGIRCAVLSASAHTPEILAARPGSRAPRGRLGGR